MTIGRFVVSRPRESGGRDLSLLLRVTPLLGGCMLLHGGGRFVALGFPLMHGTVLLVAQGGVANGMPARLDGAFSGELGPVLSGLGPLVGGERVLFMAVHGAMFLTGKVSPRAAGGQPSVWSRAQPGCVTKLNPLQHWARKALPARAPGQRATAIAPAPRHPRRRGRSLSGI